MSDAERALGGPLAARRSTTPLPPPAPDRALHCRFRLLERAVVEVYGGQHTRPINLTRYGATLAGLRVSPCCVCRRARCTAPSQQAPPARGRATPPERHRAYRPVWCARCRGGGLSRASAAPSFVPRLPRHRVWAARGQRMKPPSACHCLIASRGSSDELSVGCPVRAAADSWRSAGTPSPRRQPRGEQEAPPSSKHVADRCMLFAVVVARDGWAR